LSRVSGKSGLAQKLGTSQLSTWKLTLLLSGAVHLKKLCRAEGGAIFFGVFRVKNDDFTPKNYIFFVSRLVFFENTPPKHDISVYNIPIWTISLLKGNSLVCNNQLFYSS
jgi:hypothetical protein